MHQAVACSILVAHHAERLTQSLGMSYALLPPLSVDSLVLEGKHTHGNRANLIVATSDKLAALSNNINYVALS